MSVEDREALDEVDQMVGEALSQGTVGGAPGWPLMNP